MRPHAFEIIINENTKNSELCYEENIDLLRQVPSFINFFIFKKKNLNFYLYEVLNAKIEILEPKIFSKLRN